MQRRTWCPNCERITEIIAKKNFNICIFCGEREPNMCTHGQGGF